MKQAFRACVLCLAVLLALASCGTSAIKTDPALSTAEKTVEENGALVTAESGEEVEFASEWASVSLLLPKGWRYELRRRGNEEASFHFWPDGKTEGSVSVDLTAEFSLCCVELEEDEILLNGQAARRGKVDGAEKWTFIVFRGEFPGKCSVMNRAGDAWFDEYENEVLAILDTVTVSEGSAKKDSFALAWNTYGVSSYDSRSGKLVKTSDATNPAEYTAIYLLPDEKREEFVQKILAIDPESYPDEYDPDPNVASVPHDTIVLTLDTASGKKTIACKEVSIGAVGGDEKGRAFLSLCREISEFLMQTDAWKALPDYEFFYQ